MLVGENFSLKPETCIGGNGNKGPFQLTFYMHHAFSFPYIFTLDPDPCDPNPCTNGQCTATSDGYTCECDAGFIGDNCDVEGSALIASFSFHFISDLSENRD